MSIDIRFEQSVLFLTLNRPDRRNAMSLAMAEALIDALDAHADARIIVFRGSGGHFCAGGDIADMQKVAGSPEGIAKLNRRFGVLLERVEASDAATVSVCEGAVLGGGFGLACATDVTLATPTAKFRLPETQLGISPAQIAPFLVKRLGLAQARRLAVTGQGLDPEQALAIGLVHTIVDDADAGLADLLTQMRRCEPNAVRATKALMRRVGTAPLPDLLDQAAEEFAALARSPQAAQGMGAFLSKQEPPWA